MPYRTVWRCASCKGRLSWHQKMQSHGTCPLCGHRGRHAVTIVETTEESEYYEPEDPMKYGFGIWRRSNRAKLGLPKEKTWWQNLLERTKKALRGEAQSDGA